MMSEIFMQPPLYFSQADVMSIDFHPTQQVMAATLINGTVEMQAIQGQHSLKYNSEDVQSILNIKTIHKQSIRHCNFNSSGTLLSTCSVDGRIGFIDSQGSVVHIIKKAHTDDHFKKGKGLNRVHFIDDQTLISGDDEGGIKVWDLRTTSSIFQADEQPGSISGIYFDEQHHNVITSCEDGTIAIYDLKQGIQSEHKLFAMSQNVDEELYSLSVVKNGKYIVCPSSQGSIVIFNRNNIEQYCDRIKGLPGSVPSIVKIDENTLIAGSEDGFARGIGVYPNSILQVIGQHQEEENYGIQFLAMSHCQRILASTSHDSSIKFYDISQFVNKRKMNPQQQINQLPQNNLIKTERVSQSDLYDDDDDDGSSIQEQQEINHKKKKRPKVNIKTRESELKKQKKKQFFKNL